MMKLKLIYTMFFVFLVSIITAQNPEYNNPIAEQRADPWVYKSTNGNYYLIATVPEYDRIVLRSSKTINGLCNADEKVIWKKHDKGDMAVHIWAPELHYIKGKWYVYFAAAPSDNEWEIRIWVLSNSSADPMLGEWKEEGRVFTENDSFSLDATVFEHKGKQYMIWAQDVGDGTGLFLSEMQTPTKLTGHELIITRPEFSWERMKYSVNEGPAVLKKHGKIFVSYSASATNHNYCMGLLWINMEADLFELNNWHKSPGPVFYTNDDEKRFGPGHNSFTLSEDGETDVLIYHARDFKNITGHELNDPNRATRARAIKWTESGFPDFMQNETD